MPTPVEPQHDAYAVRHRQHTETYHASRWDSHMAGRMSRQLAESADGAAGAFPCTQSAHQDIRHTCMAFRAAEVSRAHMRMPYKRHM